MEPRKKPVPIQDTEPTPEPPVIANDAPPLPATPVNVTSLRVERPAARPSSKGGKGGGKSSGGKGSSGKRVGFGSGGHTVAHKPKKKRVKKTMFKVNYNPLLGGRRYGSKKKTTKRAPSKPGPRKRT
jgi:hypothetical protein